MEVQGERELKEEEQSSYRSIVGDLNWQVQCSKPDLAVGVRKENQGQWKWEDCREREGVRLEVFSNALLEKRCREKNNRLGMQ